MKSILVLMLGLVFSVGVLAQPAAPAEDPATTKAEKSAAASGGSEKAEPAKSATAKSGAGTTKTRIELTPKTKAPAAKATKKDAKAEAKKKEDEIGKIEGIEIARSGNRYLGIQLVDGKFKLTFYNEKKKPVAPDVSRAALRWDPKYKLGLERTILLPSGPASLASEKFVRPPYNFKLTIVLLKDAPDVAPPADGAAEPAEGGSETHVIDFRQ